MPKNISSSIMRNKTGLLRYSLKSIPNYLKYFLKEHKEVLLASGDIEPVHRMRVASRRLRAALNAFKSILPKQKAKLWKKEISKIGQALGRARELDVHIRFLRAAKKKLKNDYYIVNTDLIIKSLVRKREQAQKQVEKVLVGFEIEKNLPGLKVCLRELSSETHRHLINKFYNLNSMAIQEQLNKLFEFVPYITNPRNIHELHQMRIAAKNLRYTLEIIKPWYGAKIDKYIRISRNIQDALGDLHELDVLIELLSGLKTQDKEFNRTLEYLLHVCGRLRNNAYSKFIRIWNDLQKRRMWVKLKWEI